MTLKQKLSQKIEQGNTAVDIAVEKNQTNKQEVDGSMQDGNILQFRGQNFPVQIVPEMQISINEAKLRVEMLQQFVKEMMVPGIDFGMIPNCPKPTLFKAGAEKLTDIFGFSKQLEIINRVEDWEKGFFAYEVKITLTSKRTGHIEAEGVGSCNSKEKKYKTLDAFSLVNTILKMAKKRAIVDAVLSATRSSGLFTQDIEDMDVDQKPVHNSILQNEKDLKHTTSSPPIKLNTTIPTSVNLVPASTPYFLPSDPTVTTIPSAAPSSAAAVTSNTPKSSARQLNLIFKLIEEKGISTKQVSQLLQERFGLTESKQLSIGQASDLIKLLLEQ